MIIRQNEIILIDTLYKLPQIMRKTVLYYLYILTSVNSTVPGSPVIVPSGFLYPA